jgi:hypothetical protein
MVLNERDNYSVVSEKEAKVADIKFVWRTCLEDTPDRV